MKLVCLVTLVTLSMLSRPLAAQDLTSCRSIADDAARLACYDSIAATPPVAPAAVAEPTAIATTPAAVVGADDPAAQASTARAPVDEPLDDPIDLFGRSDREVRDLAIQRNTGEALTRIQAVVTAVRESATGRLTLSLDNGQVWTQSESQRFRIKVGDTVEIRRGKVGSYFVKRVGTNRSVRVRRSE